jgi:hypothetical protein
VAGLSGQNVTDEKVEYYRALAEKMLSHARMAASEEARAGFLDLAQSWNDMADRIEALAKGKTRQ